MAKRNVNPYRPVRHIASGVNGEGPGYRVWRPDGVGDWLVILTIHGRGRFGYPGGEHHTEPGELILIKPRTFQDYGVEKTHQAWDLAWAHFMPRSHWLALMNWPAVAPGLMSLRIADKTVMTHVTNALLEANDLARSALPGREMFALNALERMLLWCDCVNPNSEQRLLDERVQRAMDFLCRNIGRRITLGDVAKVAHLSPSRLAHLFREQVGVTPQQYLENERLERAKQLLELTAYTVQQISAQVGFDNPFYFTRRFKKHTGHSPRDYRQTVQSER
jgi:AraC family transcriptional regulator of arabinose operon